jgi:WD40 repeat protein
MLIFRSARFGIGLLLAALLHGAGAAENDTPAPDAQVAPQAAPPVAQPPVAGRYPKFHLLAWSADSKSLFTTGDYCFLARWDENGRMWGMIETRFHPYTIATSPKSNMIVVGTNHGSVELRDKWTMELKHEYKTPANGVALSADDRIFATCSGNVELRQVTDGELLHTLQCPNAVAGAVAISPDGSRVAAVSGQAVPPQLCAWTVADEKMVQAPLDFLYFTSPSNEIRFAPDGKTVIAVSFGMILFWNPQEDAQPRTVFAPDSISPRPPEFHNGQIAPNGALFAGATALSPDANLAASVVKDGSIAIWSIETGKIVQTLPKSPVVAHYERLCGNYKSLRFSPDGHRLAGATNDGEIVFWQVP